MGKKRDCWDNYNRQKKVWKESGTGLGPASLGDLFESLKRQRQRIEAQRKWPSIDLIETLTKAEIRQITICPVLEKWLQASDIDTQSLLGVLKSALGNRPILRTSEPIKFWVYNAEVYQLAKKLRSIVGSLTITHLPKELNAWVLKFKRTESGMETKPLS